MAQLLADHEDIEVVGQSSMVDEAVRTCQEFAPHAVILNDTLSDVGAREAIRRLKSGCSEHVKILVLSLDESPQHVHALIEAGAYAHVPKSTVDDRLLEEIRRCRTATA